MLTRVLERPRSPKFNIFSFDERNSFQGNPDEVQKKLQEFTDRGHLLDPTVKTIFENRAHNEKFRKEGRLVLTAPMFFDCLEGITMGELFEPRKTHSLSYETDERVLPAGKVDLVPKGRKVYQDYHTFWTKHGFADCSLVDVLDFLPKVENLRCEEILIITGVLDSYPNKQSLLVLKRGAGGKFCLYRIKYDPEYEIKATDNVLFRALY